MKLLIAISEHHCGAVILDVHGTKLELEWMYDQYAYPYDEIAVKLMNDLEEKDLGIEGDGLFILEASCAGEELVPKGVIAYLDSIDALWGREGK